MGERKRIGILTSGGDCAGLNAVIRAVTYRAVGTYGWDVLGIYRATQGLMSRPPQAIELDADKVDPILTKGGTILGTTNKGNPFAVPMPDGTVQDGSEASPSRPPHRPRSPPRPRWPRAAACR